MVNCQWLTGFTNDSPAYLPSLPTAICGCRVAVILSGPALTWRSDPSISNSAIRSGATYKVTSILVLLLAECTVVSPFATADFTPRIRGMLKEHIHSLQVNTRRTYAQVRPALTAVGQLLERQMAVMRQQHHHQRHH